MNNTISLQRFAAANALLHKAWNRIRHFGASASVRAWFKRAVEKLNSLRLVIA